MNAPLANMQSTISEQMSRQNQAIEQAARSGAICVMPSALIVTPCGCSS